MFVGLGKITFRIRDARSLKAKRSVIRKVSDRVKAKFGIAIAEVGDNDAHNSAEVGFAIVGNDSRYVESQIDKVHYFVAEMYIAEIIGTQREILVWGEEY